MRLFLTLGLIALIFNAYSMPVAADKIIGLRLGGGIWNSEFEGDIGTDQIDIEEELGMETENQYYYYLALEHPVFFIPNFQFSYSEIGTTGDGTLNTQAQFDNIVFSTTEALRTQLDANYKEVTFYYEIFDDEYTLDIGFTARNYRGEVSIEGELSGVDDAISR